MWRTSTARCTTSATRPTRPPSRRRLTPDIVREISAKKDEPSWMLDFRLKALDTYQRMERPTGPSLEGLDMDHIVTYVKPATDQQADWESLPDDVKNTFDRLGIPEAERAYLAGVGAQYDSELVYHNMQKTAATWGSSIPASRRRCASEVGGAHPGEVHDAHPAHRPQVRRAPRRGVERRLVRLRAEGREAGLPPAKLLPPEREGRRTVRAHADHRGGRRSLHFIEGCSAPKYNVANLHAGAVELFVGKRASLRYSTIENWSKNMYNLNTKRAVVQEGGAVEWISGSFGSHVGYLYPMSILAGRKSTSSFTGITFAGAGQNLDTGCKVVLAAPDTSATVETKSISKGGGASTFRSSIVATENARARPPACRASRLCWTTSAVGHHPAMDIRCKQWTSATRPPSDASATTRCST